MGLTSNSFSKRFLNSVSNSFSKGLSTSITTLITNSGLLSSTIGDNSTFDTMLTLLDTLGWRPISLIGKDHSYIYDHVRRNSKYIQTNNVDEIGILYVEGTTTNNFTFYFDKLQPSIFFADPYTDSETLEKRIEIDAIPNATRQSDINLHYAESFIDDVQMGDNDGNGGNVINTAANTGVASEKRVQSFSYTQLTGLNDLIHKTNRDFNNGSYRTLIARFHTGNEDAKSPNNPTQTAISRDFGMSHGRNLLKLEPDSPNGYDNPYCRVWTYHHQYHTLQDAIRPFISSGGTKVSQKDLDTTYNWAAFRSPAVDGNSHFPSGGERLDNMGVLNRVNGLPNIAPFVRVDSWEVKNGEFNAIGGRSAAVKNCMFSIENLAWKGMFPNTDEGRRTFDEYGLSPDQKGPLGGRIMWFPPYDIKFSESVSVNWNSTNFIGRGESIYTYSNTERSGTLSFKMLIDHPAILDYWDHKSGGKDANGTLNKDGVDGMYNEENALLRFFAGCEILSAKNQKIPVPDNTPAPPPAPNPKPAPEPPTKKMYCLVYYPNNYSGSRDSATGIVKPIEYLINGVGTQKYVYHNEFQGTEEVRDIPTSLDKWYDAGGIKIGGYEVRPNAPISQVGQFSNPNNDNTAIIKTNDGVRATYDYDSISGKSYQGKVEYITDSSNSRVSATTNNITYELAKMIGKEAKKISSTKNASAKEIAAWNKKRWYYRVDEINTGSNTTEDIMNQVLPQKASYMDVYSFQLNGNGYADVTQIKEFGITQEDISDGKVIALTDLFVALNGDKAATLLDGCYDQSRMELAKSIMNEENGIKVTKIEFKGHASSHDINSKKYNARNKRLAKQRAESARYWLLNNEVSKKFSDRMEVVPAKISVQNSMTPTQGSVDNKIKKLWRSASIIISYTQASSETLQEQYKNKVEEDESGYTPSTIVTPSNGTSASNATGVSDAKKTNVNYSERPTINQQAKINSPTYETKAKENQSGLLLGGMKLIDNKYRYDNEGLFFEKLAINEPLLRNEISKKIKYFDPAFHSISPEGFNARLTFLHQCTRQGPTIGGTDNQNGNTANNLAFGRPPVCVLRIGDFYYTKIIITSLNIDYDPLLWDLNQEGIGVMPMIANISLQFHFIGGSDLAGPISRLQNAISFNYYANTGVYDNRAEEISYGENAKPVAFKPYEGMNFRDSKEETSITTDKQDEPKKTKPDNKKKVDLIEEAGDALERGDITYEDYDRIFKENNA